MADQTSGQKIKTQIYDAINQFCMNTGTRPNLILIRPDTLKILESEATVYDPVCFWEGGCKLYRFFGEEVLASPYLKVPFKCVRQWQPTT